MTSSWTFERVALFFLQGACSSLRFGMQQLLQSLLGNGGFQSGLNVINLRPNSLFCRKISSIHHHLKESEMNSVPAVPTTDQAVLPKII